MFELSKGRNEDRGKAGLSERKKMSHLLQGIWNIQEKRKRNRRSRETGKGKKRLEPKRENSPQTGLAGKGRSGKRQVVGTAGTVWMFFWG